MSTKKAVDECVHFWDVGSPTHRMIDGKEHQITYGKCLKCEAEKEFVCKMQHNSWRSYKKRSA